MSRPISAAFAVSTALLVIAPGVAAKEVTSMKVCGAEGCKRVDPALGQRLGGFGGPPSSMIEPGPYYRLRFGVGDGTGAPAGHFSQAYVPKARGLLHLDPDPPGSGALLSKRAAARLDRLTRGLSPLSAHRLHLKSSDVSGSLPPRVWKLWNEESADEEPFPRPLLAGVPAALVLGLGAIYLRRHRRA